jgi:hypothetical protein
MSPESTNSPNRFPPGHPANDDEFVSTGEVLSGRGRGEAGALDHEGPPPSGPVVTAEPPSSPDRTGPSHSAAESGHDDDSAYDTETLVEDALNYFTDDPDDGVGSPASDTDTPPPG